MILFQALQCLLFLYWMTQPDSLWVQDSAGEERHLAAWCGAVSPDVIVLPLDGRSAVTGLGAVYTGNGSDLLLGSVTYTVQERIPSQPANMSDDFGFFSSSESAGAPAETEEDPAAAFLAQQESEIAGIENDEGFGAVLVTSQASSIEQSDLGESWICLAQELTFCDGGRFVKVTGQQVQDPVQDVDGGTWRLIPSSQHPFYLDGGWAYIAMSYGRKCQFPTLMAHIGLHFLHCTLSPLLPPTQAITVMG